jgi:hypothetical protein
MEALYTVKWMDPDRTHSISHVKMSAIDSAGFGYLIDEYESMLKSALYGRSNPAK